MALIKLPLGVTCLCGTDFIESLDNATEYLGCAYPNRDTFLRQTVMFCNGGGITGLGSTYLLLGIVGMITFGIMNSLYKQRKRRLAAAAAAAAAAFPSTASQHGGVREWCAESMRFKARGNGACGRTMHVERLLGFYDAYAGIIATATAIPIATALDVEAVCEVYTTWHREHAVLGNASHYTSLAIPLFCGEGTNTSTEITVNGRRLAGEVAASGDAGGEGGGCTAAAPEHPLLLQSTIGVMGSPREIFDSIALFQVLWYLIFLKFATSFLWRRHVHLFEGVERAPLYITVWVHIVMFVLMAFYPIAFQVRKKDEEREKEE
jgi:hypothetical protein